MYQLSFPCQPLPNLTSVTKREPFSARFATGKLLKGLQGGDISREAYNQETEAKTRTPMKEAEEPITPQCRGQAETQEGDLRAVGVRGSDRPGDGCQ